MGTEWIDMEQDGHGLVVIDAMGVVIDSVEAFRLTEDGVEVIALAVTPEGNELVCSRDGGITLETIRARMDIPGGMVINLNDEA